MFRLDSFHRNKTGTENWAPQQGQILRKHVGAAEGAGDVEDEGEGQREGEVRRERRFCPYVASRMGGDAAPNATYWNYL